ncbi:MAG: hypothetical protein JF593_15530 [Novosphingobium sp.]|nr:hypothetical protein [Novosphingobium sp.]
MSPGARAVGFAVAALVIVGGVALHQTSGGGIGLILVGALIVAGLVLEPRYRGGRPDAEPGGRGWQRTGERFRDEESGQWLEVWFDPASGERRYVAEDSAAPRHP